jgi:two-component system sensor histidine kinase BaeS
MKLRLVHKLLIALFTSDFIQHTERARLEQLAPALADWYADHQDWQPLSDNPRQFFGLLFSSFPEVRAGIREQRERELRQQQHREHLPPRNRRGGPGPRGDRPEARQLRQFASRMYILGADKAQVFGPPIPPERSKPEIRVPIMLDGNLVGFVGLIPAPGINLPEEDVFLQRQLFSLLIALGVGLLLAAGLAVMLARHLSRPVAAVGDGIRSLAAGDYGVTVKDSGGDEIAALGRDVNRLAGVLSENETARQRWMADIAHELRTPLSILQGELEAMADGVRPLDAEHLASVQAEVKHINALVNDLHQLALTDSGALAYKMNPIDLDAQVASAVDSFRDKAAGKKIELSYESAGAAVNIEGDEQRLTQLLRNLLENAVRYTDEGGEIRVSLNAHAGEAILEISDSTPGVAPAECEKLFDRLYRVESSRNRGTGGSGLGLSICRNIVAAHGGTISAEPGPLGGVLIRVVMSTS